MLFSLGMIFSIQNAQAQTISPMFFGQNAWMPDTIGNASNCQDPPCILYGKLHKSWPLVKASGAGSVRFGGIAPDRNMPTRYQYIKMIDSIRAKGMEPIIQVPFHNNRYSASEAAQLVQYINITKQRNIKYWIIANEPDLEYGYTSASQIAPYIKAYASAMKAVDPTILTVGPETSWYHNNIITGLTTPNGPYDITGKDANNRYYIDILSFHQYAFNGTQTRAAMITKLMSSGGYNDDINDLKTRLASCNSVHGRTGNNAIKIAITEANVNYQNSSSDNLYGTGVNSFIGGQFVAEMYGIGMKNGVSFINMWSVVEGNTTALNIGYVDGQGNKKPAYYHFQMMAQNFSGNYISSTSSQANVKVFSSQNSQSTTVMLMNEDLSSNYNFTVRLNTAGISGTSALKVNVDANIAQEYTDNIPNQSTILLVFNNQGALIKKIVYSLASHAALSLAPTVTTYTPSPAVVSSTAPVNTTPGANLTRCSGKSTTLTVTSGTNTIHWYSSATSTQVIGSGTSFVPPVLNAVSANSVVTYYAANAGASTLSRTAVSITVNPQPVISVNSGAVCAGKTFTLVPGGAATYTFSSGGPVVSPSVTTNYSVTGTSAGCVSSQAAIASVSVSAAPVITASGGTVCAGETFSLAPSGAATYTYSSGSPNVTPSVTSTYTITGKNAAGCAAVAPAVVTVSVMQSPVISISSGSICSGNTFTLTPSGAQSYTFSSGSSTVSPATTTSYTVSGTGSNGCTSGAPAVATVSVHARPVVSAAGGTICHGSSFTITPSGAQSYSVQNSGFVVSPSATSVYLVSGTSANGCVSSSPASVNVVVSNNAPITVPSATICKGNSFTLTPSGATSYTFSSGSPVVSPNHTTTYTISGTNGMGCSGIGTATVTVVNGSQMSVNSGSICAGDSFTIVPSGVDSYTVSGGSAVVSPSINTSYTVTGKSTKGCAYTATAIAYISVFERPVISARSGSICSGEKFTIEPSGARTYSFSSGSPIVGPLVTTSYSVTGKNAQGCVAARPAVVTVTVNEAPDISVKSSSDMICKGATATVVASGAEKYSWSTGDQAAAVVISPVTTTAYTVTGFGKNGCFSTVAFEQKVEICNGVGGSEGSVSRFSVYPNPSNGELFVEMTSDAEIEILDIAGNLIREVVVQEGKTHLYITDLQAGIYILTFKNGNKRESVKVIRQ